jgi:hypothetical protein
MLELREKYMVENLVSTTVKNAKRELGFRAHRGEIFDRHCAKPQDGTLLK